MSKTRIILAEDHTIVRAGIRSLLDALDGIQVVAEAGDGREALQLIQTHQPDHPLPLSVLPPSLVPQPQHSHGTCLRSN